MSKEILIVEDDPPIRETLTEIVKLHGYTPSQAENGKVAWEKCQTESYCLILLDLNMPVMTGWEFLEKRRKSERVSNMPVVVISAASDYYQKQIGNDIRVLKKPLNMDSLLREIQKAC